MLTVTRRLGERLRINDDIQIKVTKANRGYVSLGITAPKHIPIVKSELNKSASDDDQIDSVRHKE